jgi:hypothetical protein
MSSSVLSVSRPAYCHDRDRRRLGRSPCLSTMAISPATDAAFIGQSPSWRKRFAAGRRCPGKQDEWHSGSMTGRMTCNVL